MEKQWISAMHGKGALCPEQDQFDRIIDKYAVLQKHVGRVGKQDLELSQLSFECGKIYADLKALNTDLRQILDSLKSI